MDRRLLASMDEYIKKELPHVRGVIVTRHGRTVSERYYHGADATDPTDTASVTKSVISALVGVAIKDGSLRLDQSLAEFFPAELAGADPRASAITVRDLLTMTAGFAVDESTEAVWQASPKWVMYTLRRPIAHPHGRTFRYDSQAVHLLSAILAKATKTDVSQFANARLFGPLGIRPLAWPTDPQGNPNGGFGLTLRLRDLEKLGRLYLQNGQFRKRMLIPASYVRDSTKPQGQAGLPIREDEGIHYGYLWWVTRSRGHPAFFAQGYGGQFIYVVPDLALVVAIISTFTGEHIENRRIVARFVVPSIGNPK